ncbi:MAG: hypothetical protein IIX01_00200, partial [Clostridia bacterium]|nr:hypothetical protein [Clostridia bacterium]
MKNLKKSKVVLLATASLFAGACFSAVALFDAKADVTAYTVDQVTNAETGSFKMATGASVKNDPTNDKEKSGLRYAVTLSEKHYNGLLQSVAVGTYDSVEFGVFILPSEYNEQYQVRDFVFCEDEEDVMYNWAERDAVTGEWVYTPETGKVRITKLSGNAMTYNEKLDAMAFYGSIVNVRPENMGTEMVGVGYIAYTVGTETEYVFTAESQEATNVRTMAYVAQEAIEQGAQNATWLRETYIAPVITAGTTYEYATEYYFENEIGEFVLDETKTKVESAVLETEVNAFEQGFKGYVYDEDNANNVATANVEALNGATVLKRYYAKVVPETETVTLTAVKDFELSRSTVTTLDINIADQVAKGDLAKVSLVNGNSETTFTASDYTVEENVVKVKVSSIGAMNFGKDLTVKVTLEAKDENETVTNYTVISQPFSTVSLVIKNADDLDAMQGIADGLMADDGANKELNGYFVLGNDIDYTAGNASRKYAPITGWTGQDWVGFEGVFDGRGCNIDNFTTSTNDRGYGGLFVSMGQYGVIKNVSFTNAVNTTTSGFICTKLNGRIENVFVHYAKSSNPATGLSWMKVGGTFSSTGNTGGAKIKNCMVIVEDFSGQYNTI